LVKSEKIILELYSKDRKFDEFDIDEIDYGNGRFLEVKNIRLPSGATELRYVINAGSDLNEEDNIVELVLA
jgi:hypothetical protein